MKTEVDPLVCPKCTGPMRVIAFIEHMDVIRNILKHLGLWDDNRKPAPRANAPPTGEFLIPIEDAGPSIDELVVDPIYPAEAYFLKPVQRAMAAYAPKTGQAGDIRAIWV